MHLLLFGLSGAVWLVGLVLVAGLSAYTVVTRPRWRDRPAVDIARSFIRNRVLAGAVIAGVVLLNALALREGIPARRLRKEALEALDDANPCAVEGRERELYMDLGRGIEFDDRLTRCERDRRAAEVEERAKRCQAIANRVQQGELLPDDAAWLGREADLVRRIKDGLEPADLKVERDGLPCGDMFVDAFIAAAAKSSKAWAGIGGADDVSALLELQLARRSKPALAADAAEALRAAVATVAGRDRPAARTSEDLRSARRFCDLEASLLGTSSAACKSVAARFTVLEKQEVAAAKAKDAADQAKEQRCESLRERQAACNLACMDRYEPDDQRADLCGQRCDAPVRTAGCE